MHAPTHIHILQECWDYRHGHLELKTGIWREDTTLTASHRDTELEKLQNFSKANLQMPQSFVSHHKH